MKGWLVRLLGEQLEGLIRHLLSGLGGSLVVQGLATHQQATQIVGGVVAGLGVAASMLQKVRAHQKLFGALSAAQVAQAKAEAGAIEADLKAQQPLPFGDPPH